MFEIVTSTKFLKDLKLLKKRAVKDVESLQQLITVLLKMAIKAYIRNTSLINLAVIIRDIGNVT